MVVDAQKEIINVLDVNAIEGPTSTHSLFRRIFFPLDFGFLLFCIRFLFPSARVSFWKLNTTAQKVRTK